MDTKRAEQLREAKRRQRKRDADAGLSVYQVQLDTPLIARLKAGMKSSVFVDAFSEFLRHEMIGVSEYPNLKLLCWNRKADFIPRLEAFQLYERNWRLIDQSRLDVHERNLIDDLKKEFGQGVINA